jgi:hypothetical protein
MLVAVKKFKFEFEFEDGLCNEEKGMEFVNEEILAPELYIKVSIMYPRNNRVEIEKKLFMASKSKKLFNFSKFLIIFIFF